MRKTLLFDLDGTLLNTLEDLRDSTNFALRTYGYPELAGGGPAVCRKWSENAADPRRTAG